MTKSQPPVAVNGCLTTIGLESKLPPAALVVITASLMWFAAQNPALDFALPANVLSSITSVLAGALICLAGVLSFRRAKTTVNPMKPESSSALVASGVYKSLVSGYKSNRINWLPESPESFSESDA